MLIDYNNFQVQVIFGPALVYQPTSALSKSIFRNKSCQISFFFSIYMYVQFQFWMIGPGFTFIVLKVQAFGNDM